MIENLLQSLMELRFRSSLNFFQSDFYSEFWPLTKNMKNILFPGKSLEWNAGFFFKLALKFIKAIDTIQV